MKVQRGEKKGNGYKKVNHIYEQKTCRQTHSYIHRFDSTPTAKQCEAEIDLAGKAKAVE